MSKIFDMSEGAERVMSYEEKGTWAYLVASAGAYVVYLAIVVDRVLRTPVAQVPYVAVLLWTCGASIVASTVIRTMIEAARPSESRRADVRDKEIGRFGDRAARWFVITGAAAALGMAMARWDYFWIANVIYLGFGGRGVRGQAGRVPSWPVKAGASHEQANQDF
jgi:hypothetical protein